METSRHSFRGNLGESALSGVVVYRFYLIERETRQKTGTLNKKIVEFSRRRAQLRPMP